MLGSKLKARLSAWLTGTYKGQDTFGNRYYESKRGADAFGRKRRWVIYAGSLEPTKVPGEWHGWLHHTRDTPAQHTPYPWRKGHLPNMTGTGNAYFPDQNPTCKSSEDEIWRPNSPTSKKA